MYNGSPSKYELIFYYFFLALKLRIYLKAQIKILTKSWATFLRFDLNFRIKNFALRGWNIDFFET